MWDLCLSILAYQSKGLNLIEFLRWRSHSVLQDSPLMFLDFLSDGKLKSYLLGHPNWYQSCLELIEKMKEQQIHILYPCHADYPNGFYRLSDPPLFLTYKGQPVWRDEKCLSVVGSREPTDRALTWMETHLKSVFSQVCSVSGGARGVDQKAHNMSLRLQRPTVAFLPSGLQAIYPESLKDLSCEIIETGGAMVSEFLPDVVMQRHHFHIRNRLIASISDLLLIVEARIKSGSILTANLASAMGQSLAVVPTFPDDIKSQGNLKLLFEGAQPVASAQDILSLIDLEYAKRTTDPVAID